LPTSAEEQKSATYGFLPFHLLSNQYIRQYIVVSPTTSEGKRFVTRLTLFLACMLPVAVGAAPAMAQHAHASDQPAEATPACAAPAEIPAWASGWTTPAPIAAVTKEKELRAAEMTPGKAMRVALLPTPKIAYPLRPEKPGGTVSYGGLLRFTVAEEGVWRVALGAAAWIDVVKDGKAQRSVAHGHGPDCSGIRKMVDYRLTPGTYTLQLAANGTGSLIAMVAPQP
jgi:hypothetical protein